MRTAADDKVAVGNALMIFDGRLEFLEKRKISLSNVQLDVEFFIKVIRYIIDADHHQLVTQVQLFIQYIICYRICIIEYNMIKYSMM